MLCPQLSMLKRISEDSNKRFKILTCPTHEGFAGMLENVNADFYMVTGPGFKNWDFHTRNLPKNHFIHAQPPDKLQPYIQYDMILCQNRVQQFPLLYEVSQRLSIPIIVLDHTEPFPSLTPEQIEEIKKWRGNKHVFITEHNKTTWGGKEEDIVIPHGIDTEIFKDYTGEIASGISVVNHFKQRDVFCGWSVFEKIVNTIPVRLVGENPGLSKSINSVPELVRTIASHRFFLNTSQLSPVPLSLIEAMAIGCPVVSSRKQEIPKIITHGVNGLLYDTPEEAIELCQSLIKDREYAESIGAEGRKTIIERFGKEQFTQKWNKVFQETYEGVR